MYTSLSFLQNVRTSKTRSTSLLHLLTEVLLLLVSFLETERDVNWLSQSSRWIYSLLNPYLYRQNSLNFESFALLWAAEHGNEATARLSIRGGANVAVTDKEGRTPLTWAATKGHEAVVQLLLETGKVDVNNKDGIGRTLLCWAAMNGHDAVVKMLLETGKVDVDSAGSGIYSGDVDNDRILLS